MESSWSVEREMESSWRCREGDGIIMEV